MKINRLDTPLLLKSKRNISSILNEWADRVSLKASEFRDEWEPVSPLANLTDEYKGLAWRKVVDAIFHEHVVK